MTIPILPTRGEPRHLPRPWPERAQRPVWTVHCGIHEMVAPFHAWLAPGPATPELGRDLHLILDLPWGFALTSAHLREPGSLIVTQHPCPEYWEDLWDLGAGGLLVGNPGVEHLADAGRALAAGQRWRCAPATRSALKPRERVMLRCLALGWTNERIGLHLDWSEKTVRNKLTHLFAALGVGGRNEAALYYWGLLDRVIPGASRPI